jgi:peptidyl-prolyl cis-trans isomerase SurA
MGKGNDARWPRGARVAYFRLSLCVVIAAIAAYTALAGGPAFAQEIVASINGDPITNIDIDERMKMLRVLRKPATRDAAIESLFTDRLEIDEAAKFGVDPGDSDISQQIVKVAQDMKLAPDALVGALQHAGVTPDHFKAHFRADLAFNVLVQALNKGVEASDRFAPNSPSRAARRPPEPHIRCVKLFSRSPARRRSRP